MYASHHLRRHHRGTETELTHHSKMNTMCHLTDYILMSLRNAMYHCNYRVEVSNLLPSNRVVISRSERRGVIIQMTDPCKEHRPRNPESPPRSLSLSVSTWLLVKLKRRGNSEVSPQPFSHAVAGSLNSTCSTLNISYLSDPFGSSSSQQCMHVTPVVDCSCCRHQANDNSCVRSTVWV